MVDKEKFVAKSNRLVEASYRLTLMEQRLILFAIVEARETQKGLGDSAVRIEVAKLAETFGMKGGSAYDLIADAAKTLFARFAVLNDSDPLTNNQKKQKSDGFLHAVISPHPARLKFALRQKWFPTSPG